jgi:hypothetical protein
VFQADLPGVETHVYLGQLIRTGRDASGPLRETIVHRKSPASLRSTWTTALLTTERNRSCSAVSGVEAARGSRIKFVRGQFFQEVAAWRALPEPRSPGVGGL